MLAPSHPIAVAIGETRLRVTSAVAADEVAGAKPVVSTRDGSHEEMPLASEAMIVTPSGQISELRIAAQVETSGTAHLAVCVEAV